MSDGIPWYDWLTRTNKELLSAGADPSGRYDRIGHRRQLSVRWCLSVGMWALRSPTQIMAAVGGIDPRNSERGTFDAFKHRHGLLCGPQFARTMRELPAGLCEIYPDGWTQCDLAVSVHARTRTHMLEKKKPFGGDTITTIRNFYKILPVEAYLYYRAVEDLLIYRGIEWGSWLELTYVQRRRIWNEGTTLGTPIVIECPDVIRRLAAETRDERP
jgi:hypothetical protein